MPARKTPEAAGVGAKPGRKKRDSGNEFTAKTISRDIRLMCATSLNFLGGVKYLTKVAKSNPGAYLQFVARCLVREDGTDSGGTTFVIQQLNVTAAPVPGVINSPVLEHIAPLKLVANGGEVIDAEP